jgi:protein-disulfide isomerase
VKLGKWLDRGLTAVLLICAMASSGILIRREFLSAPEPRSAPGGIVRTIRNADSLEQTGRRLGSPVAALTLVEFGDFECPACRAFHAQVAKLQQRYPHQLAISFHHYPLNYHRFAYPAARAAECANDQGRFEAYHDLLYEKQDSIGLLSFAAFAKRANVGDSALFSRCVAKSDSVPAISRDLRAARAIEVPGTPAILLNGQLSSQGPPSMDSIEAVLRRSIALASTPSRRRAKESSRPGALQY